MARKDPSKSFDKKVMAKQQEKYQVAVPSGAKSLEPDELMMQMVWREQIKMKERLAQAEAEATYRAARGDGWMEIPAPTGRVVPRMGGGMPGRAKIGDKTKIRSPVDHTEKVYTFTEHGWTMLDDPPAAPAENKIKATIHKAGHFPIDWMIEATEKAEASDHLITIQIEKGGVVVVAQSGEDYETHSLPWAMMENAEVNPILLAIETLERHLGTLSRLKQRVG